VKSASVVCPACHGRLSVDHGGAAVCDVCHARYVAEAGRPVLLVPGDQRFDDALDCCLLADEERTNAFTTSSYHLPLLRRLLGPDFAGRAVLSAGCGVGVDVDLYRDAGLDAHGVDCGSRVEAWPRRRHPGAFEIGSVTHLPYPDNAFDAVITGCLLPHIGVVGDSAQLRPEGEAERRMVAAELLRVTKPGGHLIMGNPNRLCPADLFHKGQMAGPGSLIRWHGPSEPFLLSFADYEALFGGAARLTTLPPSNYWGFHTKEEKPATRLLARALKAYFALLSLPALGWLRRSPANPWLMVLATKPRQHGAETAAAGLVP
jgi:SAM-dependent methyltransferase